MIAAYYDVAFDIARIISIVLFCIASLRILEFFYKYSKAIPLDPKDDPMYSIYSLRIGIIIFTCVEAFAKGENFAWVKGELEDDVFTQPYHSHPGGILIDIIVAVFIPIIVAALSPLIIFVVVVGVPLQMMHLRAKQKQEFVEKLKGEHIEE